MSWLLPKLAIRVESIAKVGEDFVPIALLIGYAITGEQKVEWVKPSWTLEEIKGFQEWQEEQLEKGEKHIIVSMKHIEEGPKKT